MGCGEDLWRTRMVQRVSVTVIMALINVEPQNSPLSGCSPAVRRHLIG